jgi:sugar phosphate isomerase/epimerase
MSKFILSAFADEISPDLAEQVRVLKDLNIGYMDLRSVDGVNVKDLTDRDMTRIRETLHLNGIQVACIGSPVGKSPIEAPLDEALAVLDRVIEIGRVLDTRNIRMFSFYPPETSPAAGYDRYVDPALRRLERFANLAQ